MNCIETKENIGALLDGELGDAQKERIENHLLVCADCRDTREWTQSLSSLLQVSRLEPSSARLDERVTESFRNHHSTKRQPIRRRIAFGAFVIPKPIFAAFLISATAGFWLAFQIGKINSSTVSINSPAVISNEIPFQIPAETKVETVFVEVPVIEEKTVVRTVYVRRSANDKKMKNNPTDARRNALPSFNSTIAANGFFNDVNLKGFQPPAEMSVRIIKEEKKDEK